MVRCQFQFPSGNYFIKADSNTDWFYVQLKKLQWYFDGPYKKLPAIPRTLRG